MNFLLSFPAEIHRWLARCARTKRESGYRREFEIPASTHLGEGFRVQGNPGGPGALRVGERSQLHGRINFFGTGGRVQIGDDCMVGDGAILWSGCRIVIGNRCLVSHGVNIHDSDSHPLDPRPRARQITRPGMEPREAGVLSEPVMLGDDVWIGFQAILLKGVSIGQGSVVGAGSVVTRSVPPFSLAAGNPARVLRELNRA